MSKRKRQRCKRKRLIPIQDRLSALPDSILCHILSFLPTKHAAATSILSKRWNSVWLSVFTLDLVVNHLPDIKTLHSVILSRDIKVPIQTLRLRCNIRFLQSHSGHLMSSKCVAEYAPNRINPLITVAMQRGLETLQLDIVRMVEVSLGFASYIFSCKTLTVLKLIHISIVTKDLPRINMSPLKTLHLDRVTFGCNTDMINFLLLFPTLEELQINAVDVKKFTPETEINKCLPSLITANISHTDAIPLFLLSQAHILSIKLARTHLMRNYSTWSQVPTFHNLNRIELLFDFDNIKKWEWMLEMLQQSPKLKHLIVEQMRSLNKEDNWQDPDVVPECLSSQLRTCLIRNCTGQRCELQFAKYAMRNSKMLRTMTIQSSRSIDLKAKSEVLQKISQCPRRCKLIFN